MNIVLLSGGSGQRLWPLSNSIRSKQFIKLFKNEQGEYESMVQRVYQQIKSVDEDTEIMVATSQSQVSAICNQLGDQVSVCIEPCRRDTFPAIALASAYLHDVEKVDEKKEKKSFVSGLFKKSKVEESNSDNEFSAISLAELKNRKNEE